MFFSELFFCRFKIVGLEYCDVFFVGTLTECVLALRLCLFATTFTCIPSRDVKFDELLGLTWRLRIWPALCLSSELVMEFRGVLTRSS